MGTNGGCCRQVPFAGVVLFQRFVREHAGRTDLGQVAAERALQYAVLLSSEVDMVMRGKHIQVIPSGIVPVEPDTPVTFYAPVHLMVDQRSEILIPERAFFILE